ncbi:hypothetical protein V7968_16425 [Nocardia vulneris]|uniref:hypothetical protein n=1 Tax=Nocardia vulneris TaxID=1141657 RepID=UPI0030D5E4F6
MELIDRLQDLEPGGTLVDDIALGHNQDGTVHIEYTAKPVRLVVKDKDRALVLRVVEVSEIDSSADGRSS